jgi:hypothetical protein
LIHYKDSRRNLSKSFNKNADISAHDAFLELPSSVTIKVEKLERQIISFVSNKTKGSQQTNHMLTCTLDTFYSWIRYKKMFLNDHNTTRLPMPVGPQMMSEE